MQKDIDELDRAIATATAAKVAAVAALEAEIQAADLRKKKEADAKRTAAKEYRAAAVKAALEGKNNDKEMYNAAAVDLEHEAKELYPGAESDESIAVPTQKKTDWAGIVFTTTIYLLLVLGCYVIVKYSGFALQEKYKDSTPYGEINFQKVVFTIPIFFTSLGVSLVAIRLFMPKIFYYINPFNAQYFDFGNDFKNELTAWQRIRLCTFLFLFFSLAIIALVMGSLT